MSALDLFASALGAFILIAVIALPYYLNTDKQPGNMFTKNKFFIITMYWDTNKIQDIDLIVVDPLGKKYYYKKKIHSGSSAKLVFDAKDVSKGTEMWIDNNINVKKGGKWEVYYEEFRNNENIKVSGSLYTNDGSYDFPIHIMEGRSVHHVATINIGIEDENTYNLDVKMH